MDYSLSFEFFPPKTLEGKKKLWKTIEQLQCLQPHLFSVTYGALGSTREYTLAIVNKLNCIHPVPIAPHLTCIGASPDSLREQLALYKELGIQHLVALRGDLPPDYSGKEYPFHYANELVEFVRREMGNHFQIIVAGYPEVHPQSHSFETDLYYLRQKIAAGATQIITQFFYNPDSYFYYVDAARKGGIDVPIIPGILPITNLASLQKFSKIAEAEIPRWLIKRLAHYEPDPISFLAFTREVVTELCQTLLSRGAPGLHFYTLNQPEPTLSIVKGLVLVREKAF